MKSVLISINPKWCELIANGKKTVEVRKTKPKIDVPFKVYIYCTKDGYMYRTRLDGNRVGVAEVWNGKVIGEFVCDKVYNLVNAFGGIVFADDSFNQLEPQLFRDMSCLTDEQLSNYLGDKDGYAWHISNLVIYDNPKKLSEFKTECKEWNKENPNCDDCKYFVDCRGYEYDESDCACNGLKPIERPFQSWGYVEDLGV